MPGPALPERRAGRYCSKRSNLLLHTRCECWPRGRSGGVVRRCPTCHAQYTSDSKVCPMDGDKLEEAPDPLVGRTIGGRYLVCELIGTGGMGTVYRGRHQLVGRDVALKFLSPRYASDSAARERF